MNETLPGTSDLTPVVLTSTTAAEPAGQLPAPAGAGFLAVLTFAVTALSVWVAGRRFLIAGKRPGTPGDDEADRRGWFGDWTEALAAQIPESAQEKKDFRKLLRGAGLYEPSASTSLYALRFVLLVAPLVVAGLAALALPSSYGVHIWIGGALAAAVLSITPRLWVFFRRRQRQQALRRALPDALDMLSMCVGGGLPLGESLTYVARQMSHCPALAEELRILERQTAIGGLEPALTDMASRVDVREVKQLAAVLTRSERLGTKLAGSLLHQADHLRSLRKQEAMTQANKAPVKLVFPLMFCFAPAAIILLCAPAMIELKEFLAPSSGQSVISADAGGSIGAGSSIGAAAILSTLDELNQDVSP